MRAVWALYALAVAAIVAYDRGSGPRSLLLVTAMVMLVAAVARLALFARAAERA